MKPHDEIETFLRSNVADPKLSLQVALEFARGMSQELRAALSEWDAVVDALERVQAGTVSQTDNEMEAPWLRRSTNPPQS